MDLIFDYTEDDVKKCEALKDEKFRPIATGDPILSRVGAKFYLEALIEQFEAVMDGESPLKMKLDFSHDNNLIILLTALEVDAHTNPPFASTLVFELWFDNDEQSHDVRVLYNDVP